MLLYINENVDIFIKSLCNNTSAIQTEILFSVSEYAL